MNETQNYVGFPGYVVFRSQLRSVAASSHVISCEVQEILADGTITIACTATQSSSVSPEAPYQSPTMTLKVDRVAILIGSSPDFSWLPENWRKKIGENVDSKKSPLLVDPGTLPSSSSSSI